MVRHVRLCNFELRTLPSTMFLGTGYAFNQLVPGLRLEIRHVLRHVKWMDVEAQTPASALIARHTSNLSPTAPSGDLCGGRSQQIG